MDETLACRPRILTVERLEPWSHASQHVYLRGVPEPLTMSRRFGARLRDRFG